MDVQTVLQALCIAQGTAGQPQAVETAAAYLRELVDEVGVDALGNVTGVRRCARETAPRILLEAHMDEIGFLVTGVDEQGFVHVTAYGGVDVRTLAAAEVVFCCDPPVSGVFCSTPPHLAEEGKDTLPELSAMGVDVGMDALHARKRLPPGTRAVFRPHFAVLSETRVTSKSLDDRAGVAAVLRCLEMTKEEALPCEVAVTFAVQEELGCRGAGVAAFAAEPDAAIAVDVSFGWTPDADRDKCGVLGKGPMIGWSPVLNDAMTRTLERLARDADIPCQQEVMGGDTGTDADAISSARAGVRTALLSVPLRYMHTPVETADVRDVENTARLMAEFLRKGWAAQ